MSSDERLTELLRAWQQGDEMALERLVPLVSIKLRELASYYLRREAHAHLWQTSDLMQETWLRLMKPLDVTWQDREHFFKIASQQMRWILVSYARARMADKRGGNSIKVSLEDGCEISDKTMTMMMPLHDALNDLEAKDPQKVRIVELRYFGGFTVEETAHALGLSVSTVVRQWKAARAWLYRELRQGEAEHETSGNQPGTLETNR